LKKGLFLALIILGSVPVMADDLRFPYEVEPQKLGSVIECVRVTSHYGENFEKVESFEKSEVEGMIGTIIYIEVPSPNYFEPYQPEGEKRWVAEELKNGETETYLELEYAGKCFY